MVEFDGCFLRQATAGVLGNDRPDQLQDFLARQRMARRVLRRPVRIHDSRGAADGETQATRRRVAQHFQHAFNRAQECTSVSATICAELINNVRSASST